ncbi:MAG: carbonic anhydrase [Rikenellaceae bacterium]
MKKIQLLLVSMAVVFASCKTSTTSTQSAESAKAVRYQNHDQVIEGLIEGNKRFAEGKTINYQQGMDYLKQFDGEQKPYAIVVACSDMKVPVELLFDQGVGDFIVVRTAANSPLDKTALGAVELAFNRQAIRTVIVLSHSNCDAVQAVLEASPKHREGDLAIEDMVDQLSTVLPGLKSSHGDLDKAIEINKKAQLKCLIESDNLKMAWAEGRVYLLSAHYDEATGVVEFDI